MKMKLYAPYFDQRQFPTPFFRPNEVSGEIYTANFLEKRSLDYARDKVGVVLEIRGIDLNINRVRPKAVDTPFFNQIK